MHTVRTDKCAHMRMQYKEDLHTAFLERNPPAPPPDGVHESAVALYHTTMHRFKRLEVCACALFFECLNCSALYLCSAIRCWASTFVPASFRARSTPGARSQATCHAVT